MGVRRVSVHGVCVERAADDDATGAALDRWLGGFPDAPGDAPVDLRFAARIAPRDAAARDARDGVPAFFHGLIQGFARDGGFVLRCGASRIEIDAFGRAIDAAVCLEDDGGDALGPSAVALFIALVLALRGHGLFHLHAACVVHPRGAGVLVPGTSGAGKSTVALALLASGWDYVGDDAVLLALRDGAPTALACPKDFHVGARALDAFPRLRAHAGPPRARDGKRALDPQRAFPGRQRAGVARPAALLFPEVTPHAHTVIAPLPPADAFGALLSSSALAAVEGMPRVPDQLAVLQSLVATATPFAARLGRDLLERPALLAERLEAAGVVPA